MARELVWRGETPLDHAEEAGFGVDEESFRRFYAQTARPLRAYLSRVSGDTVLADDLLQEAYLRFLRAERPPMDAHGNKSYLYRIATNLFRDHHRKAKRLTSELAEVPSGERSAERIHLRTDVARVFQSLNPRERELLWLAYVEGAAHKEIAETVGVKASSVRLLLFRARRKLARLLKEKGLGPESASEVET